MTALKDLNVRHSFIASSRLILFRQLGCNRLGSSEPSATCG